MKKGVINIVGVIAPKDPFLEAMGMDDVSVSAEDVRQQIEAAGDVEVLEVYIDSDGGSVSEGFKIYDLLKAFEGKVITEGINVCSIAVAPFLSGDERYLTENAPFLIHSGRYTEEAFYGEAWTAADLEELVQAAKETDEKILNFLLKHIGDDHREEIIAMMADESLTPRDKAIELGFATGKSEDRKKAVKAITYTDLLINKYQMSEKKKDSENKEHKELKNSIESGFAKLEKYFKNLGKKTPDVKNQLLELEGDGSIVVEENEDGSIVGNTAYVADAEGNATEETASEGDHKLDDGRTITVNAEGEVTEVKEAEEDNSEEMTALKADIEAKDARIEELEGQLENLKDVPNQLKALKANYDKLKNVVPGYDEEEEEKQKRGKGGKGGAPDFKNMTAQERVAYSIKKKNEALNQ